MNLQEAQDIGVNPGNRSIELWERAIRILARWASEPCLKKEYDRRIELCRSIFKCMVRYYAMADQREKQKYIYWKASNKKSRRR